MLRHLGDIADIRIVFVFRDKAPVENTSGNTYVFSIRDLTSNWPFEKEKMSRVLVDEQKLSHAIHGGDILLPGRGQTFPARLYDGKLGPILPSGQIYVISPLSPETVLPEFLSWYLNRPVVQRFILSSLTGTTVQALNKSVLKNLEIEIPTVEVQYQIVELVDLLEQRRQLRRELIRLEDVEIELIGSELLSRDTK